MGRADRDPDAVLDDRRGDVVGDLGDPDAVLILDATGFLKTGPKSAGVARQDTGTAGRIAKAPVGVCLASASRLGPAFRDRALDLPEPGTDDPRRCAAAGIPEGPPWATKIRRAQAMLQRAFAAGVPAAWVTGDEGSGVWELRRWLAGPKRPSVLAVRANQDVGAGPRPATGAALAKAWPGRADSAVRRGTGWHRPVTWSLRAHAVLAVVRKLAGGRPQTVGGGPGADPPVVAGGPPPAGAAAREPAARGR